MQRKIHPSHDNSMQMMPGLSLCPGNLRTFRCLWCASLVGKSKGSESHYMMLFGYICHPKNKLVVILMMYWVSAEHLPCK